MKNNSGYLEVIVGPMFSGKTEELIRRVIVSGLAMTFDRQPFAPMPNLMAMADSVLKLSAICTICGEEAVFHKRITKGKSIDSFEPDPTLVGRLESYEARCRKCYKKP